MNKKLLLSLTLVSAILLTGCKQTEVKDSNKTVSSVIEVADQQVNLKIVEVTANTDDGNVPSNVLDDNYGTRWSAPDEAWIVAGLSDIAKVDAVNISFSKGEQRESKFAIQLSTDGKEWEEVYYGESSGKTTKLEKYTFPVTDAKFVRIMGWGNTSNKWNSITELEVIGKGVASEKVSDYTGDIKIVTSKEIAKAVREAEASGIANREKYVAPTSYLWEGEFSEDWASNWEIMEGRSFGLADNVEYLEEGDKQFIRVNYPKGSINPSSVGKLGTPLGGAQFYTKAGVEASEEMELSYKVRFSSNFDFVKGGKLPGLFGGDRNASGGRIPDGKSGWSTRFMWRTNGAGEVYSYMPSSIAHGSSLGRGKWKFETNKWHDIVQKVKLNTPGEKDGSVDVFLDGEKVYSKDNLTFRSVASLKIDGIFFSTFFGGSSEEWASKADVYTDFADFKLAK